MLRLVNVIILCHSLCVHMSKYPCFLRHVWSESFHHASHYVTHFVAVNKCISKIQTCANCSTHL